MLHFALGKALADAGEEARGFEHLIRGNALYRDRLTLNEADRIEFLRRVQDVFTPDLISRGRKTPDAGPAPVFIVGMPRSGSTLIEQILAAHPLVFAAGEVEAFRDAERGVGRGRALSGQRSRNHRRRSRPYRAFLSRSAERLVPARARRRRDASAPD